MTILVFKSLIAFISLSSFAPPASINLLTSCLDVFNSIESPNNDTIGKPDIRLTPDTVTAAGIIHTGQIAKAWVGLPHVGAVKNETALLACPYDAVKTRGLAVVLVYPLSINLYDWVSPEK